MTKKNKKEALTVVKKIKRGNEVIDLTWEEQEKIWRKLREMKALGVMLANVEVDEYVGDLHEDLKTCANLFNDLHDETQDILFKYGLSL